MALAQSGQYGTITGYASDQNGEPIRGVKLTATSPTQIGGSRVAYSSEEGAFRIAALEPGSFEVRATAPNLKTVVQKGINVGIGAPAEINLIMEVTSTLEEVRVVEKPPVVSTTTATLKSEFAQDFLQTMPMASRDSVHDQFINSVGGVVNSRVRGSGTNQVVYTQDGFDMKNQGSTLKVVSAYEIQTGGYGAENPVASGGLMNLVTKSGSNKFEFEFNATADADQLRFFRDATDSRGPNSFYVLNPSVSGPILRDRLWYAFNVEFQFTDRSRSKDPTGFLPEPAGYGKFEPKGTFKLTWQITPRAKLQSLSNFDLVWSYDQTDGLATSRDAQETRRTDRFFQGFIFESLLTDNLVFRTQAGFTAKPEDIYPSSCRTDPINCEHRPATLNNFPVQQVLGNAPRHWRNDNFVFQFRNRFEWFTNSKNLGEHTLTLHDFFFAEEQIAKRSVPGDMITEYSGTTPVAVTQYYANDPRYDGAERRGWFVKDTRVFRHVTTLSDSWRPTRHLTLIPAVSHIWATGSNSRGDKALVSQIVVPSLGVAWDATGDSRTVIRGSFNIYADVAIGGGAGSVVDPVADHTAGSQAQKRCPWDAAANKFSDSCVYSGGLTRNTYGRPCGPDGLNPDGTSCQQALRIPTTYEYTFGGEREVAPGIALSMDLVYRHYRNQFVTRETNRIWNRSGTALETASSYRNGRPETIYDLETPEDAGRRYRGMTLGFKKREGRFRLFVFYTWSDLKGNVADNLDGSYGQIGPRDLYLWGYLPDDHRHEIKATFSYAMTNWLSMGVRADYTSGFPYDRKFRNDVTGGFDAFLAYRGTDPGGNINDPGDDRALRLPDRHSINAQIRVNWMPLIGKQLDTYIDVLNALALRTTTGVQTQDGPFFGAPTGDRLDALRIRLGLNYRY